MNDNDEARARSSSGNHATNDTNNGVVVSKRVDRALIGVGIALLALGTIRLVANVARTDWDDAVRTAASLAAVGAVLTVFVKPRSHGYFLGVGVILLICGVLVWPHC